MGIIYDMDRRVLLRFCGRSVELLPSKWTDLWTDKKENWHIEVNYGWPKYAPKATQSSDKKTITIEHYWDSRWSREEVRCKFKIMAWLFAILYLLTGICITGAGEGLGYPADHFWFTWLGRQKDTKEPKLNTLPPITNYKPPNYKQRQTTPN